MSDKNRSAAETNVQVVVRCRPVNSKEVDEGQQTIVRVDERLRQIEISSKNNKPIKAFQFDNAFGPSSTQRDIYSSTITPIVDEVLSGYNCTIFAYGQTGTGKTYTMEGRREAMGEPVQPGQSAAQRWKSSRDDGIIARSVNQIFETLEKSGGEFSIRVSHLELYNEELRDLLNPTNKSLKLYEDASSGGRVVVHNLEEKNVYTPQDVFEILQHSWEERRTAETEMNRNSSRSHCIFSITIHIKEASPEGEDLIKIGKLNLVDLAGSENIGRSGADKVHSRKQEACMINKSLLTLGRVITALTENSPHIPYRESKLTRLLQDSLGGTTKTCIIATISPASGSFEETLSTLDYAYRAKSIKNRPEVNAKMSKREVLKEFTMEIHVLKAQLDAMRRQQGVYLPLDQFAQMETNIKEQNEKIQFYEDMIQLKEKEMLELQEMFDRQSAQLDRTTNKLSETSEALVKTSEQLKVTEESLVQTKESLNEHKYLLHEHEETEVKFHDEAATVIDTLDASLSDIQGLFAKIDRKDNLESSNVAMWQQFRQQLLDRVYAAQSSVSRFIQEETTRYSKLHQNISSFVAEKNDELQLVGQRLEQLEASLRDHFDTSSHRGKTYAQESLLRLEAIQDSDSKFDAKFSDDMQRFTKQTKTAMESLQSSLAVHADELARWSADRKQYFAETTRSAKMFSEHQLSSLSALRNRVDEHSKLQISRLEEHSDVIKRFMAQQQEQNLLLQKELMEQVQRLIGTYIHQQEQKTASIVNTITCSLSDSASKTVEANSELISSIETANKAVSNYVSQTERIHRENEESVEMLLRLDNKFSANTIHMISSAGADIAQTAKDSSFAVTSRSSQRHIQLDEFRTSLQSFQQAHETHMVSASEELAARLDAEIKSALAQQQSSSSEFSSSISTEMATGKHTISQFGSEFTQDNNGVASDLSTFSLQEYQSTGSTPQKKEFVFPRDLSRTKPKHILLQEFRKQREAGVEFDEMFNIQKSPLVEVSVDTTSTSTLSIDEDIDVPIPDEMPSPSAVKTTDTMAQPPLQLIQSAQPAQPTQPVAPIRAPSAAKLPAAKRTGTTTSTSAKPALPKAPSMVAVKKAVPAASAAPSVKKLVRAPSKTQLQEITNK